MQKNKPTRDQHIVPQAYLNRFGTLSGKKYSIGVYDKKKDKYFRNSVDNVGYIKDYYNVKFPPKDEREETYWENYIGENIDTLYGAPLRRLIAKITLANKDAPVLSAEDKALLAKLISFQLMRVPNFIDKELEKFPEVVTKEKEQFIEDNQWLNDKQRDIVNGIDFPQDMLKDILLGLMTEDNRLKRISNFLLNKVWTVFYNETSASNPFCTSDNPVVLYSDEAKKQRNDNSGIGRFDTTVFYPLTPKIMVALYPKYMYQGAIDVVENRRMPLGNTSGDFILRMNMMQLDNCHRNVFIPISAFEDYR